MRRTLILLLLLAGMQIIQPLGHDTPSSEALLAFGFLILAAYTVGEIVNGIGLPKLVGYLLAGIVFGPSALHTVSYDVILRLNPVNELAVSLIAFLAGAELKWSEVKQHGAGYLRILGCEMGLTFAAIIAFVVAAQSYIPVLADQPPSRVIVFALLLAVILVAHSPAATLGLLTETRARGPVARTSLGVVLVSDVVLILLFTIVAAISRGIVPPPGGAHLPSLAVVVWEIAGAFVVGAAIGGAIIIYLRFAQRELLLFGIIVAMLGAEIARLTHVELLLTILVAGFITENFSAHGTGEAMRHAVERAAAPVFVVFFALSGASIAIVEVVALIGIVGPLALLRAATIWAGTSIGTRWAKLEPAPARFIWTGLIAQAGVAIGLASIVATFYPEMGAAIRTTALAVIAINQLIGPVVFRRALQSAGEISTESGELGVVSVVAGSPGREE
jgi:Kef-type K+ transport system membrane component KefB